MIRSFRLWTVATACLLSLRSAVATGTTVKPTKDYSFDDYVHAFGKVYSSEQEREARQAIFQANLLTVLEHNNNHQNQLAEAGGYTLGINEWSDRRIPDKLPLSLQKKVTGQHGPGVALFSKKVGNRLI